MTMGTLWVG